MVLQVTLRSDDVDWEVQLFWAAVHTTARPQDNRRGLMRTDLDTDIRELLVVMLPSPNNTAGHEPANTRHVR